MCWLCKIPKAKSNKDTKGKSQSPTQYHNLNACKIRPQPASSSAAPRFNPKILMPSKNPNQIWSPFTYMLALLGPFCKWMSYSCKRVEERNKKSIFSDFIWKCIAPERNKQGKMTPRRLRRSFTVTAVVKSRRAETRDAFGATLFPQWRGKCVCTYAKNERVDHLIHSTWKTNRWMGEGWGGRHAHKFAFSKLQII